MKLRQAKTTIRQLSDGAWLLRRAGGRSSQIERNARLFLRDDATLQGFRHPSAGLWSRGCQLRVLRWLDLRQTNGPAFSGLLEQAAQPDQKNSAASAVRREE